MMNKRLQFAYVENVVGVEHAEQYKPGCVTWPARGVVR